LSLSGANCTLSALALKNNIRPVLAIIAGLMIAASFPKIGLAGLAWVAPGLMLASALGATGGQAFRLGWLAGFANWLAAAYWILLIPVPIAPIVGWLLLGAFLGLYSGTWLWLAWKLFPIPVASARTWTERLDLFLSAPWRQRLLWSIACAALWVAWEMAQARFLTGFPWDPLGASQYQMLPLIQIASITAAYGVSFVIVWFSVALFCGVAMTIRRPHQRWAGLREVFLPVLALASVISFGVSRINQYIPPPTRLKVALVQPSIPQTQIWDPEADIPRFRQLLSLSEAALSEKPQLLLWPEAAVPSYFRWNTNRIGGITVLEVIGDLARRHKVWIVMGADDLEPSAENPEQINYFNSSFVVSPSGEIGEQYRKRRLVMFGEYVPLARWLPFLKDFTGVHGAFTPGTKPVQFRLGDVTASVLICFEDVFAHLAREHVTPDTDFLLNLTNNGWFGESAAQWQHAITAIFRAVENRTPLVRCANNGLTCWVDPTGKMHEVYFADSNNIYKAGYKIAEVSILGGKKRDLTFYTRHGDWFGWGCVALSLVLLAASIYRTRARSMPLAERN
jgi:apolipoprotein N-acyltransferase